MTATRIPDNDPGFGLRSGVTEEQLVRAARESREQAERNMGLAVGAAEVAFVLACAGAFWLYRRRAHIIAVADNAAVATAVGGLKAPRKLGSAYDRFVARVRERAGPPVDKDLGG
jgi:hypothetical protein